MGDRLREDIFNIKIWQEINIQKIQRTPENQHENHKKHMLKRSKIESIEFIEGDTEWFRLTEQAIQSHQHSEESWKQ